MSTTSADCDVLLVGAGPVGLITALNLAREGIKVILLEGFDDIIQSPRAMAYGPAGVYELERSGIADECRELGMSSEDDYNYVIRWITIDNKPICSLESSLLENRRPPVVCGQHLVAGVILRHLQQSPELVTVLFGHKCVGIEQDEESVTAIVETKEGEKRFKSKYLVGADGARSTVRKQIGCTFDGFTYDKMIVATNVYYPFIDNGFHRGQFIVHPQHFALVGLPCDPSPLRLLPLLLRSFLVLVDDDRLRNAPRMECTESLTAKILV
jgi:2-polyprenyl-6-methoxyphenol hydroxylase-like FAD-dependent oxidoreductase